MDHGANRGDIAEQQPLLGLDYSKRLLTAVTSLTAEMSQAGSRDDVLGLVAAWTPTIVPADRASVTFPIDDDHLEVFALEGSKAIPMGVPLPIAKTTTGKAFREKRTINVGDTASRNEFDSKMLADKGLRSCLNAPIMAQGRVIGALNVAHWKQAVYTPEHEALLLHVAGIVAAQLALLDRFFGIQERLESEVAARTRELELQKEQLKGALDKERELSGLQRHFVAMVSHEFRTPLAIIDGSAQRLVRRQGDVTPDRLMSSVNRIRTSVSRLTDLMESVLSAARLENGTIEIDPSPCDICDLVSEVCLNHQEVNPTHHLIADLPGHVGEICVDANLIRQVVSNLVSNAIKYSPAGTHIWVRGDVSDGDGITLSVRDEGPGIPSNEMDKLFDRFFRGSTSTGIIGTGIGLHMAQVLVALHGGNISVDSAEGKGTTFTIHLPADLRKTEGPIKAA